MTVLEVLQKTRDLISDPERWTQKVYARDENGEPCGVWELHAHRFCLLGAVQHVSERNHVLTEWAVTAIENTTLCSCLNLNDICGHAAVLDALDRTILRLQKEQP